MFQVHDPTNADALTLSGLREFQASSAIRTFLMASSNEKGGTGGLRSAIALIERELIVSRLIVN
jgi:hypothetical protein